MKNVAKKSLATGFIFFILVLAIANCDVLSSAFDKLDKKATFSTKVAAIHDAYVKQVKWKNTFVNINGAFMRWTGQRVCNKVAKLKNGMLSRLDYSDPDPRFEQTAQSTIDLARAIERCGIPFVYACLPGKMSLHHAFLPTGLTCVSNQEMDTFLATVNQAKVKTLDVRPYFSSEDFAKYYYTTDHHWNALGALNAAPHLVRKIEAVLKLPQMDLERLAFSAWDCHVKQAWWLGAEGKRTGRYYGGLDDLIYLTPKFEMESTVIIPHKNILRKGNFEATNLVQKYIQQRQDLYSTSAYYVYTGGDYPIVRHRTVGALSSKKVLLVKDSLSCPLQGFLSVIFQHLDVIDMRHFKDCSLLEYIVHSQPDIVVMATNPSALHHVISESKLKANESIGPWSAMNLVKIVPEFVVKPSPKNKHNFQALDYALESGKTYHLNIEKVDILEGKTEGLSIALYDPTTKKAVMRDLFDIEYANAQGGFHRMFKVPTKGPVQLIIYSGIAGATQGISVKCTNLRLMECVE